VPGLSPTSPDRDAFCVFGEESSARSLDLRDPRVHEQMPMFTLERKASVVLVVLSICTVRSALADPPKASASVAVDPRPSSPLPFFGLLMGATEAPAVGLSGFLSVAITRALARTCVNRCPPSTWAIGDPSLAPLGKTTGAKIAMHTGGVGLAIGIIALRGKRRATDSALRRIARSLAVKPVAGGAGLSINF
jgi:hypothetical protein